MYQQTVLENGIRVVTESIPHVRSVAIGFWYRTGSRDEPPHKSGMSHFIEHLMFKGTKSRSARAIAETIDASGGQMNAYTSKEHTCYYARVLDQHVGLAIELLADMLRHSVFDPGEMRKEKGVILEEIKMYEDSPDELVHDLFAEAMYPEHPLGQSVLGRAETVGAISRSDVLDFLKWSYTGNRLVVAAAGNLNHQSVVDEVRRRFELLPGGELKIPLHPVNETAGHRVQSKDTEQVHLCVGSYGLERNHSDEYAMLLLDVALGGGMSSRFFQDLREDRGLVYSTYTYHHSFQETGLFSVYAATSPDHTRQVLELIFSGLRDVAQKGLSGDELARAKEQLKGSLMIGLENTANRMSRIARAELFGEDLLTPDEIIAKIDRITLEDVERVCHRLFHGSIHVSAVGPVDESVVYAVAGTGASNC